MKNKFKINDRHRGIKRRATILLSIPWRKRALLTTTFDLMHSEVNSREIIEDVVREGYKDMGSGGLQLYFLSLGGREPS